MIGILLLVKSFGVSTRYPSLTSIAATWLTMSTSCSPLFSRTVTTHWPLVKLKTLSMTTQLWRSTFLINSFTGSQESFQTSLMWCIAKTSTQLSLLQLFERKWKNRSVIEVFLFCFSSHVHTQFFSCCRNNLILVRSKRYSLSFAPQIASVMHWMLWR